MPDRFQTDARLAADALFVAALPLCDVRLMREARWLWLILVPRIAGATEIFDLTEAQRARLMREMHCAACALRAAAPGCKINIGALGNIVRQLHIHIIARHEGDAAWPNPVWGQGAREAPSAAALEERRRQLEPLLRAAVLAGSR